MIDYNPQGDGVTHVNVYSKSRCLLGKLLSNFAATQIEKDGLKFASIESWWYWTKANNINSISLFSQFSEEQLELLRENIGNEAKSLFRKIYKEDSSTFNPTPDELKGVYKLKLEAHPNIKELLLKNELPLTHYYMMFDKKISADEFLWTVNLWDEIKQEIINKKTNTMNFKHFSIFARVMAPAIEATDAELEEVGSEFYTYLQGVFKDKPEKLEEICKINPLEAMMSLDHPFKTKGYNSIICLHFFTFIEKVQKKAIEEGLIETIPINIWDDFYDDGHVPEGEKQETHIYVEDSELDDDYKEKVLTFLLEQILTIHKDTNILEGVSFEITGDRIEIENMTHKQLGDLMEEFKNGGHIFYDKKILSIYSES